MSDESKPHRLLTPLKGKLVSDLGEPGAYISGQVDSVAELLKHGGPEAAEAKLASSAKRIADLERERERVSKIVELLDSLNRVLEDRPGKIIADTGKFRSAALAKSIKLGKATWIDNVQRPEMSGKIILAQKFKISTDVPNASCLYDFGGELQREGLLRMPFDKMYVEYKEEFANGTLPFSIFVENWNIFVFLYYMNKWLCFHVEDDFETVVEAGGYYNFMVFLVLLASRSTTVLPSDELGKPMEASTASGPRLSHHLVKLRSVEVERAEHGGHHAPPRLHWRRGHIRRQRHGPGRAMVKKVWIAPMLVGDAKRGVVTHDYQVCKGGAGA